MTVYRRVLAAAPDQNITIASIGFATNLAGLLQSPPDSISPLNGSQLVAAKVKRVVWMGGNYPVGSASWNFDCGGRAYNPVGCQGDAGIAVGMMPTSVDQVFSGLGKDVLTGGVLTDCAPPSNPCRRAIIDRQGPGTPRSSWDPLVTLTAIRGVDAVHCNQQGRGGRCVVSPEGVNKWVTPGVNETYLAFNAPANASMQALGRTIDVLLCRPPALQDRA